MSSSLLSKMHSAVNTLEHISANKGSSKQQHHQRIGQCLPRCCIMVVDKSAGLRHRRAWVQIAVATLSGNSFRQAVHTHCAFVHQAAKLVAAPLRVAGVTAGLVESNGSLQPGLWLASPAGWLPRTRISSVTLFSVIEYGLPLLFLQE